MVLVQVARSPWQVSVPSAHSSMSVQLVLSPLQFSHSSYMDRKPDGHVQLNEPSRLMHAAL